VAANLIKVEFPASLCLDINAQWLLRDKCIRNTDVTFYLLFKGETDRKIGFEQRRKNALNLEWRGLVEVAQQE